MDRTGGRRLVIPVSPAASANFSLGYGGDLLVGYRFDHDFSLSADLGYYDCNQKGSGGGWIYIPVLAVARYNFEIGWIRPYVLLRAGMAVNTFTLTPSYSGARTKQETDLLLAPGLGVMFTVSSDTSVYIQTRFDLNFATPEGPWADNPSVFLPLKGGISFFIL